MTDEDLSATSFIEQRQIARLILADPAERTRIVNGWIELGQLQRAEEWLKGELAKLLLEQTRLPPPIGDLQAGADRDQIQAQIDEADETIATCKAERTALVTSVSELVQWRQHEQRSVKFRQVREQGQKLKAEIETIKLVDVTSLRKRLESLAVERSSSKDRAFQLRELVDDQWDGVCPKTCEACPVQKEVRTIGMSMSIELAEADSALDQVDAEYQELMAKVDAAERDRQAYSKKTQLLEQLRVEAKGLLPSDDYIDEHGKPPPDSTLLTKLNDLDLAISKASRVQVEATAALERLEAAVKASREAQNRRSELSRAIRLHQEAIAVVGRQGAQREVAEGVLRQVEAGANRLLQAASIDLSLEVSWAREGKGLASHCDACGSAFPKAQSQKVCAICGAQRGPKMIEKLQLLPSDRSGAADDIGGLAFQLAASAWLRAKRSAPWAVVCIDEPFGQLDRANTRNLSTHLHSMIRNSFAFEQGFLVAHDASVMEALPGRIQIRGTPTGSTVEVIK
jgi:DNA repair exonuclease SbcCD ATPase subunit